MRQEKKLALHGPKDQVNRRIGCWGSSVSRRFRQAAFINRYTQSYAEKPNKVAQFFTKCGLVADIYTFERPAFEKPWARLLWILLGKHCALLESHLRKLIAYPTAAHAALISQNGQLLCDW